MFRVTVVVLAALALLSPSVAAAAPDELSTTDRLDARRFVTAGPRAYDVGTEAGRYPAMGFHTRGEMGGIWSPPMKLLDGIWFGVDGAWIGPATQFTSGQGYVKMALPGKPGAERRAHRLRARRGPRRARRPALRGVRRRADAST